MAAPLALAAGEEDDDEPAIQTRVMVVASPHATNFHSRATLACGEEIFRMGRETSPGKRRPERGGYCEILSHRVDSIEGATLEADKCSLVEVVFTKPLQMSRLYLGGDPGRREWLRGWGGVGDGGFYEILGFSGIPSPSALAGTRHYLRLKHGLDRDKIPGASASQIAAARADGVFMGNYFGTLLLLR
jgi:hypothetical protein